MERALWENFVSAPGKRLREVKLSVLLCFGVRIVSSPGLTKFSGAWFGGVGSQGWELYLESWWKLSPIQLRSDRLTEGLRK